MKITFRIHYYTQWGQQMAVSGDHSSLGSKALDKAFILNYQEDGFWEGSIEIEETVNLLSYRYLLIDSAKGNILEEWGEDRKIELPVFGQHTWLNDAWRAHGEEQNVFHTSAFLNAICRPKRFRRKARKEAKTQEVLLRFQMDAPAVPIGYQLGVLGDMEELGNWNANSPLLLDNKEHPKWSGEIVFPKYRVGVISYKYCLYNPKTKRVEVLEGGPNRKLSVDTLFDKDTIVLSDQNFTHPEGPWKGAGLAIPVFSIRTEDSLGVGEFHDLKKMIDWATLIGMKMVQILPVNDTSATLTWVDSYPYSAISVFALHPILLHIDGLPGKKPKNLQKLKDKLNANAVVDYEAVMSTKLELARAAFKEVKDSFQEEKAFQKYFKENKFWLESYAAFSFLRDRFGTADYQQWETYSQFSPELLEKLIAPESTAYEDIQFYYFLQFHLDQQLREAADYARSKGIVLKGDLPIGIYRHSVDAWVAPELYNMDGQSGAPPDPFSDNGQNWGFPTYNWDEMAKDGYQWWVKRMQQLARYFDAYRIDHILGFFRIWDIPYAQVDGLLGVFNPAIPIHLDEFAQKKISFDRSRFCEPFITESSLKALFPEELDFVKYHFLVKKEDGNYAFKEGLHSQRAIQTFFEDEVMALKKESLLAPLFQMVANVLFIPDKTDGENQFHPRIDMPKTQSFQALPSNLQAKLKALYLDYFYNRQEGFWRMQAMKKLPALRKATDMLICGEDLGMVPECVPGVMQELSILTLEIQRMSKNPATEFLSVDDIPYLSVASPSTHDMSTIRGWWEESTWEEIQRFYEQELKMIGDHPFYCEPYIAQAIVNQHLSWPSMWTVFPVQDLLAMDGKLRREDPFEERINVPANPKHYWQYRMHLNIEQLLKEKAFNGMLHAMLSSAKRI